MFSPPKLPLHLPPYALIFRNRSRLHLARRRIPFPTRRINRRAQTPLVKLRSTMPLMRLPSSADRKRRFLRHVARRGTVKNPRGTAR